MAIGVLGEGYAKHVQRNVSIADNWFHSQFSRRTFYSIATFPLGISLLENHILVYRRGCSKDHWEKILTATAIIHRFFSEINYS